MSTDRNTSRQARILHQVHFQNGKGPGPRPGLWWAVAILVVWASTGPLPGFSNTWQLAMNTGTKIVTFLLVSIMQNTQNRDSAAFHLKLDAIMHGLQVANSKLYEAEDEGGARAAAQTYPSAIRRTTRQEEQHVY